MNMGGRPPPMGPGHQPFGPAGGTPFQAPPGNFPVGPSNIPPGPGGQFPTAPPPGEFVPGNMLKNKELLYRLMISQLFYDGYQQVAIQLTNAVQAEPACPPSERLLYVTSLGFEKEAEVKQTKSQSRTTDKLNTGPGLDLEYETDIPPTAPEPALYETAYVTSHKSYCRAGAINQDGSLCATGSHDASIKILDVERMLAKSNMEISSKQMEQGGHPVIRTLYDHMNEVTTLDFHPREQILASGSRDCTVKLFDFSKASAKKAMRNLADAQPINSVAFHPTGDFLLVGTAQEVVRMYDTNTSQCFVAAIPGEQHRLGITCVKWSNDGKCYVSASEDGAVKIWDGVSSRCITTFFNAHDGAEVCSAAFTKNGKYIMTSGKDSMIKLWELSTSRCLIAYTGAGATGKQELRAQAVFNHNEDYVMFPDEATTSLCCWDARNASRKQLLSLGHNGPVRYIVHSAVSPAFLTCSDDFRARFWYKRSAQ